MGVGDETEEGGCSSSLVSGLGDTAMSFLKMDRAEIRLRPEGGDDVMWRVGTEELNFRYF